MKWTHAGLALMAALLVAPVTSAQNAGPWSTTMMRNGNPIETASWTETQMDGGITIGDRCVVQTSVNDGGVRLVTITCGSLFAMTKARPGTALALGFDDEGIIVQRDERGVLF